MRDESSEKSAFITAAYDDLRISLNNTNKLYARSGRKEEKKVEIQHFCRQSHDNALCLLVMPVANTKELELKL